MLDHVLVPLDGSELAEKALSYARQIIKPSGRITLLTALDIPDYPMATFYPTGAAVHQPAPEALNEEMVPRANEYLQNVAEGLRQDGFEVNLESVIDDAAAAIVQHAESLEVDAIVMSTHGRSGLSRWLFGSVAGKVLSSTDCPMFIVPVRGR